MPVPGDYSSDPWLMNIPLKLARGCYLPTVEPSFVDRCAALLAISPAETVAVGRTAATLHGLWLPAEPIVLEFSTCEAGRRSAAMHRSRRPEIHSHRRQMSADQRTTVNGVPATSLARTWWDLAADLSLADLVAAGDRALQLGCAIGDLEKMIIAMSRRRGNSRARDAITLLDARSRSRPESHLRVAVRQAGLDCFGVNEPITDLYGQWLAEPDLSCVEAKIALEYQGIDHADPARMGRDITRATDLRHHGWAGVVLRSRASVATSVADRAGTSAACPAAGTSVVASRQSSLTSGHLDQAWPS